MRKLVKLFLIITFLSCNPNTNLEFKLCSGGKRPYYYPTLEYKGGFYIVKKHFFDNFKASNYLNNTGIVKIRFDVNCKGETGNFMIDTYNMNYRATIINDEITKQLLYLTKELKNWIPAQNDKGETINSFKFFTFKLSDGKLVDILPK
jgi:hypothetical protein